MIFFVKAFDKQTLAYLVAGPCKCCTWATCCVERQRRHIHRAKGDVPFLAWNRNCIRDGPVRVACASPALSRSPTSTRLFCVSWCVRLLCARSMRTSKSPAKRSTSGVGPILLRYFISHHRYMVSRRKVMARYIDEHEYLILKYERLMLHKYWYTSIIHKYHQDNHEWCRSDAAFSQKCKGRCTSQNSFHI